MGERALSPGQRMAVDLGPLLVFFVVNYAWGILPATAALVAATVAAIAAAWAVERTVAAMPAIACVFVAIFGGLTLAFDDDLFIKLKPTAVSLLFAGALATGLALRRNPARALLGRTMRLREAGWRFMAWAWIAMFLAMAGANEIARRALDTDGWVAFKSFGLPAFALLFGLALYPILRRHALPDEDAGGER